LFLISGAIDSPESRKLPGSAAQQIVAAAEQRCLMVMQSPLAAAELNR
jgi:hypothetical protein